MKSFSKITVDDPTFKFDEFIKKRKINNNNFKQIKNKFTLFNPTINNNNTDNPYIETKKPEMHSYKKSISNYLNQEESSELASKKTLKNILNENNKSNNKPIKQIIPENCSIHIGKNIEYYCNTCSILACGICLIEYHNGHNFGLLDDTIDKIKMNMCDANNILNELLNQNYNNQKLLYLLLNEVNEYKKEQESFVIKSFDEIVIKLNQIKNEIIKEFDEKYNLEFKRIEKYKNKFGEEADEVNNTKMIINEILKEFDITSDVKVLRQKKIYDNFLYWCDLNIKRIYKNQKKLINEVSIDPSIKPFPINITELIVLYQIKIYSIIYIFK